MPFPSIRYCLKLIAVCFLFSASGYVSYGQPLGGSPFSSDSPRTTVKSLSRLYSAATSVDTSRRVMYQQQFFDAFPNSFNAFVALYGQGNDTDRNLMAVAEQHVMQLFNNLETIDDSSYYTKLINIAAGGRWSAGAVNSFQIGLRNRVIAEPLITASLLQTMPDSQIRSFWRFYFDGALAPLPIEERLLRVQEQDTHVYDLMNSEFDTASRPRR